MIWNTAILPALSLKPLYPLESLKSQGVQEISLRSGKGQYLILNPEDFLTSGKRSQQQVI
ncbi:MAG: hypothetical protein KME16_15620 [Scytolyngbya sp. HA4215-MV1]|nr:hypothetical protein [Scytolyngbya sp. HA4215-MV1]